MASQQKRPLMPYVGCLLFVLGPIALMIGGSIYRDHQDQKKSREQARLESARAKAMELCQAWSEKQPSYVNKPGLYRYSQTFDDKIIGGTSIWIPSPDEFPKQEPSARCVINYSEREHGVAEGILVPAKYRSKDWPCHRGKRLNPDHEPGNILKPKYINCMPAGYQPPSTPWKVFFESIEPAKVWKFDLEGNQIADK